MKTFRISCACAGRISLRTGNLTGNLHNIGEFTPFWVPARLIVPQYQEVAVNSLFREPREFLPEKQGIRSKDIIGYRCKYMGCKDIRCSMEDRVAKTLGARCEGGYCAAKDSRRAKRD